MKSRVKKKHLAVKYSLTAVIIISASLVIPQILSEAPKVLEDENPGLNLSEDPLLGNENASVRILVFGDYKCTTCSELNSIFLDQIRREYIETGKAKLYFLNYDYLSIKGGGSSTRAAVAGECMLRQSKEQFWNYHRKIYETQGPVTENWATEEYLLELARKSTKDINYSKLKECISSKKTLERVNKDKSAGIKLNVGQTPAVFVEGEKISNPTLENIRSSIESELAENESERHN